MSLETQESFEAELNRLRPAPLPADFAARLSRLQYSPAEAPIAADRPGKSRSVLPWLRWCIPAGAATALVLGLLPWRANLPAPKVAGGRTPEAPVLKLDQIEINREWLVDFQAVAKLPSGEPVRLRYREWVDDVVARDSRSGLEIQHRVPRFEIVPVRFETY